MMAARLVRCIEGLVFDRAQSETCPTCGNPSPAAPEPDFADDQDESRVQEEGGSSSGFAASALFARLPPWASWGGAAVGSSAVVALLFVLLAPQGAPTSAPIKTLSTTATEKQGPDVTATKSEAAKEQASKAALHDTTATKSEGPGTSTAEK